MKLHSKVLPSRLVLSRIVRRVPTSLGMTVTLPTRHPILPGSADEVLDFLKFARATSGPQLVLPTSWQWRVASHVRSHEQAELVMARPEFIDAMKWTVRGLASWGATATWLATDPRLSDGKFLLGALDLAMSPRGWLAVHVLGNRPGLARAVLDLGLEPLYPAAARHTATMQEHVALMDGLAQCADSDIVASSLAVFAERADVSWLLRQRAVVDTAGRWGRDGVKRVAAAAPAQSVRIAWDAVTFAEAGEAAALANVTGRVAHTRRGASAVLASRDSVGQERFREMVPGSVIPAAVEVARSAVGAMFVEQAARLGGELDVFPPDVTSMIAEFPLSNAVAGPTVGGPTTRRSLPPPGLASSPAHMLESRLARDTGRRVKCQSPDPEVAPEAACNADGARRGIAVSAPSTEPVWTQGVSDPEAGALVDFFEQWRKRRPEPVHRW
jgi:hypothetical protein